MAPGRGGGGGQMVSVLDLYSDDPVLILYAIFIVLKWQEKNGKRPRMAQFLNMGQTRPF